MPNSEAPTGPAVARADQPLELLDAGIDVFFERYGSLDVDGVLAGHIRLRLRPFFASPAVTDLLR